MKKALVIHNGTRPGRHAHRKPIVQKDVHADKSLVLLITLSELPLPE
jgi:hypothetical protein